MKKQNFKKLNKKFIKKNFDSNLEEFLRTIKQFDGSIGNNVVSIGGFLINFEILNQLYELNDNIKKAFNLEIEEEEDIIEEQLNNPISISTKPSYNRNSKIEEIRNKQLKPSTVEEIVGEVPLVIEDNKVVNPESVSVRNARKLKPDFISEEVITTNSNNKISASELIASTTELKKAEILDNEPILESKIIDEEPKVEIKPVVEKTTPKKPTKKKITTKKK